jgi:small subunit ribosomal protein S18
MLGCVADMLWARRPRFVRGLRYVVRIGMLIARPIHDGVLSMAQQFQQFQSGPPSGTSATPGSRKPGYLKTGNGEEMYVDYKAVDDLRRLMTPNGKIYSRKRLAVSAREQRMISQAVKRARYMALLPYTDATL